MEEFFLGTLRKCYVLDLSLDFIVCPDIVARGCDSLRFSLRYASESLSTAPRLALAVQDGMMENAVRSAVLDGTFTHLFVGGTVEWKWETAAMWVKVAHDHGMKCHIGRCGTLRALDRAAAMEADSVDSASFVRNDSWHIVRQFQGREARTEARAGQLGLFDSSNERATSDGSRGTVL
ncbi:MAG: hypothetical protein ABFE01_20340 [Phycisphaerales bacterium]